MAAKPGSAESAIIVPVDVPVTVRQLRDRMDPAAAQGVPAHITLLYPFAPPAELDDDVRATVGRIVAGERAFPFALSQVGRWPEVVYLISEPALPFKRLIDALCAAYPQFPPYGGEHDLADIVPHLTVAHDARPAYLDAAERALPSTLPFHRVADEAWLIAHPAGGRWRTVWRFPLGVSAPERTGTLNPAG